MTTPMSGYQRRLIARRPTSSEEIRKRVSLARDLSQGSEEKAVMIQRLPLFEVAMGASVEEVLREHDADR